MVVAREQSRPTKPGLQADSLAGGWIGAALVDWISAHRETVALTQPWLFPSILTLVALGMMKRRDGAGA